MSRQEQKQEIVAKLMSAASEVEQALKLSAPSARYDPEVIPQAIRDELSAIVSDLDRMLRQLSTAQ